MKLVSSAVLLQFESNQLELKESLVDFSKRYYFCLLTNNEIVKLPTKSNARKVDVILPN